MSVFKRKTSRGTTSEYHYKFMQQGKSYHGVCEGCQSERTAQAYEKKIKETVKVASSQKNVTALVENFKQELTGSDVILLADAYERYLSKPKAKVPSETRERTNRKQWNNFIEYMSAKYPDVETVSNVTRRHAEEYIAELRTNGRFIANQPDGEQQARKVSANTINAYHKQCRSVFFHLKEDAGLISNPFDFPLQKGSVESREAFTPEELKKIGDSMDDFVRPIFIIGICSGLSEGDICLLEWKDINDGWISRRRRKTGAVLDIPILPPLAMFLDEQKVVSSAGKYVLPDHAEMYKSNPWGISHRVKKFLTDLDIETTRKVAGRTRAVSVKDVHSLRHTFAYMAGCYQIPLPVVQSILGHMSPEMTKHYQAHADRQAKEKYLSQMPYFLNAGAELPQLAGNNNSSPDRDELIKLATTIPDNLVLEAIEFIKQRNPAQ